MTLRTATALLTLALSAGTAAAQPAQSLKEQIVGTWNFVVAEVTAPDDNASASKPAAMVFNVMISSRGDALRAC